ncbi:MAG: PLP-dependent aminotransferase family protein [Alphaproteobacteria bacterium]|nr:PLP-dependent aminotransferase family protein [Alphaproteobacteria bacterium]
MTFDYTSFFRSDLPAPAARWSGFPRYNFVGGHNDADQVPVDVLADAARDALLREGKTLATYGLESGPQGYVGLRALIAAKLQARAKIACTVDDILVTAGSLQALDLVNAAFLEPGDTVIVEADCYGGTLGRLKAAGVRAIGIDLDDQGMRMDHLASVLEDLKAKAVKPKFLYTIPTVQNPTGTVLPEERRRELLRLASDHDFPIFEDDCYADLLWDGERPPAIRALDDEGRVIYCGSFSKSIAPALRLGYIAAEWPVLSRLIALKKDGGSGALEQMTLAAFDVDRFDDHVTGLKRVLKEKCAVMMSALDEHFGTSAEFKAPKGGIFIWVTLPPAVDTTALAQAAAEEGVTLNPGADWSTDPVTGRQKLRLCFGNPTEDTIRAGIAKLAEICHRETGIPARSANIERTDA